MCVSPFSVINTLIIISPLFYLNAPSRILEKWHCFSASGENNSVISVFVCFSQISCFHPLNISSGAKLKEIFKENWWFCVCVLILLLLWLLRRLRFILTFIVKTIFLLRTIYLCCVFGDMCEFRPCPWYTENTWLSDDTAYESGVIW